MTNVEPTETELQNLAAACNRLWKLDVNRMHPNDDYDIDLGEGKRPFDTEDKNTGKLFKFVKKDRFMAQPTYRHFYTLLDNYDSETGRAELVTQQETSEQIAFIEACYATPCGQYLHKLMVAKDAAPRDVKQYKAFLHNLWFKLYRRETQNDSSGFEHVFVGEHRDGEVIGFHNWIQFFIQEMHGKVNYKGFIYPKRRSEPLPTDETRLVTAQFDWAGEGKSMSSILMGVSPEFELALYTLCFVLGQTDNHMELDGYDINVKCHRIGQDRIGSCYPIAE
eukprot:comp11746_c0_seq1/m.6337 comp11746_c0_seq1/g.6337  ORF comp11746_c0_seq1/g.6337 comp11746_c0_seq1/m.6337 type:complete len:279 (-) comp11746_c0_seq1:605-1441(-)